MNKCFQGDCRTVMRQLIADGVKVQTIVTSPPYWGLRDYGVVGQLGQEPTLREFIVNMTDVFELCRELLADDGTLWLNMGDSYASRGGQGPMRGAQFEGSARSFENICLSNRVAGIDGLKNKDLCGQPWRLAFALQDAGWFLRQDIIWHKPNPMPESVRDRCTKAHEYLFLLTKSERYYYDFEAMQEPAGGGAHARKPGNGVGFGHGTDMELRGRDRQTYKTPDGWDTSKRQGGHGSFHAEGREKGHKPGNVNPPKGQAAYEAGDDRQRTKAGLLDYAKRAQNRVKNNESMDAALAIMPDKRNKRSVWTIATESYKDAHFATFPRALVEPCILAGSKPGDIVFDPFMGSGTVGQVAQQLGRRWLGAELNPDYIELQSKRTRQAGMIFA